MKTLTTTLLGLAAAIGVRADCPTKERPTTKAEQQFYLTVTPALKQAASAIPAGWTAKDLYMLRTEARGSTDTLPQVGAYSASGSDGGVAVGR